MNSYIVNVSNPKKLLDGSWNAKISADSAAEAAQKSLPCHKSITPTSLACCPAACGFRSASGLEIRVFIQA